jgi:hypothetical protein
MASEEPVYKIHSMVRKVATRTQRATSAKRHRFVQRLAGGDITVRRARAATVSESKLKAHIKELREAVREGRIVVKTPTHQVVDIFGDEFHLVSETPVAEKHSPPAQPPQDSVANDKTFEGGVGENRPMYEGATPQGELAPSPSVNKPLTGEDQTPIQATGDPARARAAEEAAKEAAAKAEAEAKAAEEARLAEEARDAQAQAELDAEEAAAAAASEGTPTTPPAEESGGDGGGDGEEGDQ